MDSGGMRITFKLFAMLTDYLPRDATGRPASGNAVEVDLSEGTTVQQLVEHHALPAKWVHLVLLDGHYLPPAERAQRVLRDGETLAIWPPIAGG